MFTVINYTWKRTQVLLISAMRTILVPLFLFCATPRGIPILSGEMYPILLSWVLGLTNGLVGSIPMIQAPSKVPEEYRELAGESNSLSSRRGHPLS